ncbi:hypothetical protein [Hymenobacter guriensis]|uniref:Uncharacterized protein n=1 Tax=Hymenobacter guriensis TaxID=2793065 RepID=A0ABS0L4U4_9BACT|nr:hypothetical protein [Hymenobacter guriensis]MBG8555096.1 hypothetical protein [Hymenobacter guriensis]
MRDPSAFPYPETYSDNGDGLPTGNNDGSPGMSLLDYYAGQALVGLATRPEFQQLSQPAMATKCFEIAHAMLNERQKQHAPPAEPGLRVVN